MDQTTMMKALSIAALCTACGSNNMSSSDDGGLDGTVRADASDAARDATTHVTDGQATRLTDAQIVGVLHAVNMGEMQEGSLASTRASASNVMAFAADMVAEHQRADSTLLAAASAAGLTPQTSDTQTMLERTVAGQVSMLMTQSGVAFDDKYISFQIDDHQTVLGLIDSTLLRDVTNAALRAQLEMARAMVADHLTRARSLAGAGLFDGGVFADGGAGEAGASDGGVIRIPGDGSVADAHERR